MACCTNPQTCGQVVFLQAEPTGALPNLLGLVISERAQSCSCSIDISDTYVYIYICVCVWPYVKLYAHARWYVMWEELSVNHFLKHSNHLKRTQKCFKTDPCASVTI